MAKLALDLGTTTGFAWTAANGCVVSGTWDLRPKKFEGGGWRFIKFQQYLDALHALQPIEMVWFEAVRRHIGTDAGHVYGGLMGKLQEWCDRQGVPYQGVPVQTIKKEWTGKGNAKKDAMIAECLSRGFEPHDDNEADAIALLCIKCPDALEIAAPASSEAAA
jgi:Holliday junction resolvasome RuvABC endonuclease subunit